ncbi:hypothetical protein FQN54_009579 [Arachnomyces sp. PD_36]|nr:hypothetical protein FQN54_009579 [Arachnomyces sp. PD_36]
MSLFGSLEKSTGAQLHLTTGSIHLSTEANRSMRAPESRACRINSRIVPRRPRRPAVGSIADIFINSLIIAGYCKHHAPHNRRASRPLSTASRVAQVEGPCEPDQRPRAKATPMEDRMKSTRIRYVYREEDKLQQSTETQAYIPSKQKPTTGGSQQEDGKLQFMPFSKEKAPSDSSSESNPYREFLNSHPRYQDSKNLLHFYLGAMGEVEAEQSIQAVLSNENREIFLSSRKNTNCLRDRIENPEVERLVTLLREDKVDNQAIFKAYKTLPKPGVSLLSESSRGRLLHRFANPPKRRYVDARRYLAIFQDMNDAGLHMSASLWTAAIYLTGRCSPTTSRVDLKAALGVWRRMEHEANIQSSSVTFNVLFDIAIKAEQYMVANSLLEEMNKRGIEFSRCGKVTQIFLCGLQQDAAGIYEAYNKLVRGGEIVDTIVLNCVMVSLIRAGEYDAAKRMYDRMKDVHQKNVGHAPGHQFLFNYNPPPINFSAYRKASKRFGRLLGASAYLSKTHPEQHRILQATVPLTPDSRTFHIFLSHHSRDSGDLQGFMEMVDDMETIFAFPPQGMVYIFLFEGFARHGRNKKNIWTYERLKVAWASFLRALHQTKEKVAADRRTKLRREKMEWAKPADGTVEIGRPNEKLPSFSFSPIKEGSNGEKHTEAFGENVGIEEDTELDDEHGHPHHPSNASSPDDVDDELDFNESDHGVYLGRRIVIACLRAFAICGGNDAALEAWEKIHRLWKPNRVKAKDIMVTRAVLNRILSENRQG